MKFIVFSMKFANANRFRSLGIDFHESDNQYRSEHRRKIDIMDSGAEKYRDSRASCTTRRDGRVKYKHIMFDI
jgi:hypothetical protein